MKNKIEVSIDGHVLITDADTNEVYVDKHNAIHSQNMARIIARALAKENNGYIHRIAFGNGGTVTDPTGQIIFNSPNDGRNGSWESRLYNETYSEIVDETDPDFGSDPGSAEPGKIRTGGGAVPEDDPEGGGVTSVEVGTKSNIVISVFLNKNEPTGQINTINDFGVEIDDRESRFVFDEIGLYSPGKQANSTSAYTSINVGNKTSEDISLLSPNETYVMEYNVDGIDYATTIQTPSGGSGVGGAFTYGDICEGLNDGSWIVSGDNFTEVCYVFITDRTSGLAYPTINNKESYGFLTFQTLSEGSSSSISIACSSPSNDLFRVITNNICSNVGVNETVGNDVGVANNLSDQSQERERLLSHIIFPPVTKTADKALNIVYTLTVSVARTANTVVSQTSTTETL